jgi:hypothetical protein
MTTTTRVLSSCALGVLLATSAGPALAQPAPPEGPQPAAAASKAQVEHAERQQVHMAPSTGPATGGDQGMGAADWQLVLASLLGAVAVGSLAVAAMRTRPTVRTS